MTTLEAIRAELVAAAGVTALVGQRLYPMLLPQGATLPAIVLTAVSDVPLNAVEGLPAERLREVRLQVDAYATTYLVAHQVAEAVNLVVAALNRHDLSAQREGSEDLYDDEAQLFRVSADFTVWHAP